MALPLVSMECRAAADPDLRFSASGTAVGRVRVVASSRKKDDATGEWKDDKTCWLDVTCFDKLAENVAESVQKGDLLTVTGRLQTDEWENEQGEKRSRIVMIADSIGVALRFRYVHHGEGRAERAPAAAGTDPWTGGPPTQSDEPPF